MGSTDRGGSVSGPGWASAERKWLGQRSPPAQPEQQGPAGAGGDPPPSVHDSAYAAWRRGEVNPSALTMALDSRGLYGPQVDIACGVREPAVDQWEAGTLYPSWEQLQSLAALTGYPVQFFVTKREAPPGRGFMCIRGGRGKGCHPLQGNGEAVFDVSVVARCPGTDAHSGDATAYRGMSQVDGGSHPARSAMPARDGSSSPPDR